MKKINLFFFICSICFFLFLFFLCSDSLPYNTVSSSKLNLNKKLFMFIPQGWGFFSRSPREPEVCLFTFENGSFRRLNNYQADLSNLLGIGRNTARLTYEYESLLQQIKPEEYRYTQSNIQIGNPGTIPTHIINVHNDFDNPRLIGQYLVVIQSIIPWSWVGNLENEHIKGQIFRLNIHAKN